MPPGRRFCTAQTTPADIASRSRRALRASFAECPALEDRGRGATLRRARGMPGARCTRSLVCSVLVAHECSYRRFTGITRHSRTRMVLTVYAALSPATNSSCRRHRRIEGFAEPGWVQKTSADLTPATGARTTRFCRPRAACAKAFDGLGTHPQKFWRRRFQHRSSARRLGLTGLATCPARALRARRRRVHRIPSQRS
jgi:hypothetical protein